MKFKLTSFMIVLSIILISELSAQSSYKVYDKIDSAQINKIMEFNDTVKYVIIICTDAQILTNIKKYFNCYCINPINNYYIKLNDCNKGSIYYKLTENNQIKFLTIW